MSETIQQLLRESNPPPGQPASPVPQYHDRDLGGPRVVEGYGGAPGAVLLDRNGQPITSANRLPVDVGGPITVHQGAGPWSVQSTGSDVPLRGLASERPAASAANKGYVFWAIDTGDVSVSTGTTWRSLGVA